MNEQRLLETTLLMRHTINRIGNTLMDWDEKKEIPKEARTDMAIDLLALRISVEFIMSMAPSDDEGTGARISDLLETLKEQINSGENEEEIHDDQA